MHGAAPRYAWCVATGDHHEFGLLYVVVVYHGDVEKVLALVAVGERLSQLKQSPARRRLAISFRVSRLKVWEGGAVAGV